jgi:hypothetical protein
MDASNLAQQILGDMWELGRPILIMIAVVSAWGSIYRRSEEQNERTRIQTLLVLVMLGMIGPFAAAVFFNLQSANLITLMRIKPAWGIFTALVALLVFPFLAIAGYRLLAASRRALPPSLRKTAGELPRQSNPRKIKLIVLVLSLLVSSSILWLWRIAQ